VLDATGVAFEWDRHEIGQRALDRCGDPLPRSAVGSVRANGVALKGPVATPFARRGFRSVNTALRRELDLKPNGGSPGALSTQELTDEVIARL
jgi:isocitrate dehydrogenase (NAD+)